MQSFRPWQWVPYLSRQATNRRLAHSIVRRVTVDEAPTSSSSIDQEALYRKYLTVEVRDNPFRPCADLLGLDPAFCNARLPDNLKDQPLLVLDDASSSLDEVTNSLESCIAEQQNKATDGMPRTFFDDAKIGSRALLWFLKSESYNRMQDIVHLPRFFRALAYSIVAERKANLLIDLILVKDKPHLAKMNKLNEEVVFRLSGLRSLVEAQSYWTDSRDRVAEPLRTIRHIAESIRGTGPHVPLVPSVFFAHRAMTSDAIRTASTATVDEHLDLLRYIIGDKWERKFNIAEVLLRHPSGPDAHEMLSFLKSTTNPGVDSAYVIDKFAAPERRQAFAFFWTLIRTAQCLNQQGRHEDAHWVIDLGKSRLPRLFTLGKKPHGSDLRYKSLYGRALMRRRRRPTAAELRRGVPVDDEGFVATNSTLRGFWMSTA